jgi:hypothetical protein
MGFMAQKGRHANQKMIPAKKKKLNLTPESGRLAASG